MFPSLIQLEPEEHGSSGDAVFPSAPQLLDKVQLQRLHPTAADRDIDSAAAHRSDSDVPVEIKPC